VNISIRRFNIKLLQHLSDYDLALMLNDELPLLRMSGAMVHLEECGKCRARWECFEFAASQVTAYRDLITDVDAQQMRRRRNLLVEQIEKLSEAIPEAKKRRLRTKFPWWTLPNMSPILTTAMFFAFASVVCVFLWLQQGRPKITSNALLVRAEAWDTAMANQAAPCVIRQTIRIKTAQGALDRIVYRDALGKRHPRSQKLVDGEEQLKEKLATAGIAWDAPLSATTYQDWHDRQRVRQDEIRRLGAQNLILTTTTPNGVVASQSLIVRETDFHPVGRTIAFRDTETVEIAELDYKTLPWTTDSSNLFEPNSVPNSDGLNRLQPMLVPLPPPLPTGEQLDEAELGVRLVLNKLQADTGEQIRIERNTSAVEVKGLVNTDQRKRDLVEQLRILPRVRVVILSIEELERESSKAGDGANVTVATVSAHQSPLEAFFGNQGRDAKELRDISQRLLSVALTASQESRAMTDLVSRFTPKQPMTILAKGTLATLIYSHRQKLFSAVEEEQQLLTDLSGSTNEHRPLGKESEGAVSMIDVAERNLTLCEELTLGSNAPPREAEVIFAELAATMRELRIGLRQDQFSAGNLSVSTARQ
jgi:hypothetical protein